MKNEMKKELKKEKRENYANETYESILDRLESGEKKVELILTREDFKKELSFPGVGFGYQDLKEKNKMLAIRLISDFNVKIEPLDMSAMECLVTIKYKK